MDILVLGGYGTQGVVICRELVKHPRVSQVVCAGRSLERAQHFVDRLGSEKLSARLVHLGRLDELRAAARDVDVVINTASWTYNLRTMKACVESGVNYQDLALGYGFEEAGMPVEKALEAELELDGAFKNAGAVALANTGMDPGVSDIIAGYSADKLEHVYEIRIKDCEVLKTTEPITTWSPYLLWTDMIQEPIVYRNGKFERVQPFSHEETYVFPAPIGPQPCYQHAHEEVVTMPHYLKDLRYVEFKMCGPDMPFAKALYDYGFAEKDPVEVKGVKIVPFDVFLALTPPPLSIEEVEKKINDHVLVDETSCMVLDIDGEEKGMKVHYAYYTMLTIREANRRMAGTTATSYMVGIGAEVFTELLVEGQIKTKGVAPPEGLIREERAALIRRLADKGIRIYETAKKPLV